MADQVRWRIRRDFPTVSEVLVSTKTEPLPCPMANDLRQPPDIEQDVRARLSPSGELRDEPRIKEVRKVTVHYVAMQPLVEVLLRVEPSLTVAGAAEIAKRVQGIVEGVKDVSRAEVHLDLTGHGAAVWSSGAA